MRIAPDQFEGLAQYLAHGVLPRLRDVHESAIMFDEKIDAIGRELAIDQRARRIELSLERIERRTHFWQRDMVRTPDGVEHVRFDEINEGQTLALLVGDSDDGPEEAFAVCYGIHAPDNPGTQSGGRNAEIAGHLDDSVSGYFPQVPFSEPVLRHCFPPVAAPR